MKWTGAFRLSDDEKDIDVGRGRRHGHRSPTAWCCTRESSCAARAAASNAILGATASRRDYEPEGRLFLAAAIDKLIRHSGTFAKERVARFLKQGGPDAVLAEIDRLDDSSYVRRVYYSELLKQAPPSDALLAACCSGCRTSSKSDYDKATLLTRRRQAAGDERHRIASPSRAR